MNRWSALAIILAFAGALAFRLPRLETRPIHTDEAVNAVTAVQLWQNGEYRYNPDEHHGPTLHYATLPFLWLSGASNPGELKDQTLRLAPVFFGAGLILLIFLFPDALGRPALAWSALFLAISPAMVFYSRYFIHEQLLVFFTGLTIGAGWKYSQSRSPVWAALCGFGLGLMFATKETFVISLAAMWVGCAVALKRSLWKTALTSIPKAHYATFLAAAFVIWLLLFSSFFTNLAGLKDSFLTYLPWIKRAGGESPHIHPWYFYLQRLGWFHPVKGPWWSEGLILGLAGIGMVAALRRDRSPLLRFFAVYTIALLGLYSAISYKTPWCLLGFYHGLILLAGVGAATLVQIVRMRSIQILVIAVILAASGQLAAQAWRASFEYASDRRNPYVYAQTVPDIMNLVERIEGIGKASPEGYETVIKVIAPESDYWPLPWYLRRFKHIGWYDDLPADPFAAIVIVSSELNARLDDRSNRDWIMVGLTELRPRQFLELYVEFELWSKYVETLPREPE